MLKIIELFGGIGAWRTALTLLGIDAEYDYVEFDVHACNSYNAMFNENFTIKDVREYSPKWEQPDYIVGGFPCQDLSLAGKQAGLKEGTRSFMFKSMVRICLECEPKNILFENVKPLMNKKHWPIFLEGIQPLLDKGYEISHQLINAKQFIAQNRERVFVLLSKTKTINVDLSKYKATDRIEDYLMKVIPKGYELIEKHKEMFYKNLKEVSDKRELLKISNVSPSGYSANNVYSSEGISPTIRDNHGAIVKIAIAKKINVDLSKYNNTEVLKDYLDKNVGLEYFLHNKLITCETVFNFNSNGVSYDYPLTYNYTQDKAVRDPNVAICGTLLKTNPEFKNKIIETLNIKNRPTKFDWENNVLIRTRNKKDFEFKYYAKVCPTLQAAMGMGGNNVPLHLVYNLKEFQKPFYIRKLTPKECWRLMGFPDWYFERANKVCTKTQLYKQAGNSIVVPVLEAIVNQLEFKLVQEIKTAEERVAYE